MTEPSQKLSPTILQVIPALVTGGAERGCIDMAIALSKAGGKPIVASEGGPMVKELDRAKIPHINLPLASENPLTIWRNAAKLVELIKQNKVDIIHARSRAPAWSAWLAARRTKIKFVTTFHATYNYKSQWKKRYNSIMTKGDRIIAISSFIRNHIVKDYSINPSKIRLIHRGVDFQIFSPERVPLSRMIDLMKAWQIPEDKLVIMLPGRLTRWKGQEILIQALAQMKRQDICCVLVGSDQGRTDYRQELLNQIKASSLESTIKIVDHCSDMPAAYMLSHVVVSASTDPEAFGRVIVEAQAMGKPVIVTNHGAVDETIIPDVTGWAVSPGNVDALAQTLNYVLSLSIDQRYSLASKAISYVHQHFSKEKMCAETLAVYQEILT